MKLLAYILNGTPINELSQIPDTSQLNGNLPFKYSETVIDNYSDITTIENIDKFGYLPTNDYIWIKDRIKETADSKGGWNSCTTAEKYILIKYYCYRDLNAEKIAFLMSQGYTQQQAMQYLVKSWFKHNKFGSFIDSIMQRWKFSQFYLLMMCTKASVESELERIDIAHSVTLMEDYGVVGSDYGDTNRKGIMNYFNSTGLYAGIGFIESPIKTYSGITKQMVLDQIIDVMINGNYDPTMCN